MEYDLERLINAERSRIVGLCAHLTGDRDAAEELAHEALLAAWQRAETLQEPERASAWLNGFARNMSLRWLRRRHRTATREVALHDQPDEATPDQSDAIDQLLDDLDRVERERLLDQALCLLPESARSLLVRRYIDELPLAELAAELHIPTGAAALRLHRARAALQQLFTTRLPPEAALYGLVSPEAPTAWQPTRIWCPFCGQRRLDVRRPKQSGDLEVRCPCCCNRRPTRIAYTNAESLTMGLSSYKSMLSRQLGWLDAYYRAGLAAGAIPCLNCGPAVPIRIGGMERLPANLRCDYGLHFACPSCGALQVQPLSYLALDLPATRQFWRRHPRMHALPNRTIVHQGSEVLLSSFESLGAPGRLDILSNPATLAVVAVTGDGFAP